jgi:hypothetical protein
MSSGDTANSFGSQYTRTCILRVLGLALIHIYIYIYIHTYIHIHIHIYIYIYIYIYQRKRTPLDRAVEEKKEEAAAVLRAHGALHSLHFAATMGMTDEVAAGIAAGQDLNARDEVIFLCVCVWVCGCVEVAILVRKSFMYTLLVKHSLDKQTIAYPSQDVF